MKTTFFSLLLASFLFIGCATEETTELNESANLEISTENNRTGERGELCSDIPCVATYVYPTQMGGQFHYQVFFDQTLTIQEVDCKRQGFFNCFANLRMTVLQPSDPYHDSWVATDGKPHTSITNAICSDPETGLTIQCN